MNPYYEQYVPGQNPSPFYEAYKRYPFCPFSPWEDEKARDQRKFRELYPSLARQIQPLVEEECDRMEYDGSFMFDEYPDKLGVLQIVNRIFAKIKQEESECTEGDKCTKYPDDQWLKDIIMVLLLNEMYRRRRRKRYY